MRHRRDDRQSGEWLRTVTAVLQLVAAGVRAILAFWPGPDDWPR